MKSRSFVLGLVAIWLLAVTPTFSAADGPSRKDAKLLELSLEDLMKIPVGAASGFMQGVSEAPSYVTILTAKDLRAFGYRTLADALSSAAGFYASYDRTYHFLGVRGFSRPGDYNTRTLVLINGARVNDPIYSTGRIGMDLPLDLDLIDRIEIVRGASSSLYGTNAFFAVINIVTREAKELAPAEAAVSAGSYQAFSGRVSVGHTFGEKGNLLISGSLLDSEGDDLYFPLYDTAADNNGIADGLDGEKTGSLFLRGGYGGWTLQAVYLDREKERPTAAFGTLFNDPGGEDCDREAMVDLSWTGELAKGWQGMARIGYQRYEYTGDWPYDYAAAPPPDRWVDQDKAVSDSIGGEARIHWDVATGYRITAGAEMRRAYRIDQKYTAAGQEVLNSSKSQTELGFYLQGNLEFTRWAVVNAGFRYDSLETYNESDVSPRAALILKPFENSVLKLVYGEAFRAPNAYERFYDDGGTSIKAPLSLEPETIRSYEVVWEQRIVQPLQINVAVYRYEIQNLITQVLDPSDNLLVYQNLGEAEARGFEVEGILDLPVGFQVRGSYAYCKAEDGETGAWLSNSPKHLGKLSLLAPIIPRWLKFGLEAQYVSDRLTAGGEEAEDYVVINTTLLSTGLLGGLDVSLSVYNIFDKDYLHVAGDEIQGEVVEQDGRSFRLKVTYRF
jgi:iron complex outermembrane receptor protein